MDSMNILSEYQKLNCGCVVDFILSELECPICTEYMRPPILQCEKGHTICQSCKNKLKECGFCKGESLETRCLAMERLSTKLVIPCRNSPEGCEIVLPFYEMSDHYDECMFQTLKCPFFRTGLSCKWEGLASPLRNHIIEKHWLLASKYQTSKDYVMKIPLTGSWYHVMIFGDDVFFRFTRVTNGNVHLCVFYVGPKKMASVFKYTVSIESRKRDTILSMTCVARHYLDEIEGVLASEECCTMNKEFVFKCVNEMMILPVHLKMENCVPKN